ncbi:hypothetical protein PspLS_01002 [Pyricularia sp. CBS 133598]|nr:hypothetical protein PspLS_01002 [Pyricularia sp. CBS 133598]
MGIIRKTLVAGTVTAAATLGYIGSATTLIRPLPVNDSVFTSKLYKKHNIHRNPPTQDVVTKRVPLDKIRPELLEKEGDIVLEFCRGVWTSPAYEIQRRYLARKYHNASTSTAHDLWSKEQLSASTYEPGTIITDHFQVLERTPTSITVRCGDSPRNQGPRDSDGLFTFSAVVDRERGEVELGLKSTLFPSSRKLEGDEAKPPMPPWMEDLHTWYARFWMVSGYRRLLK